MSITDNIKKISTELKGRAELIAVSKRFSQQEIREAYAAGVRNFGENYLDEALLKIEELKDLKDITWHYQGRMQTKKINKIVGKFNFIHTLASTKHLQKIEESAQKLKIKQNVLIQVKHKKDERDYALSYKKLGDFLIDILLCKNINLAGLMYLPPQDLSSVELIESFQEVESNLKKYEEVMSARGHSWNMVSMGMSEDYLDAAENGATHVRVGSKIFGNRE